MQGSKSLGWFSFGGGILVVLIGIAHASATPMMYNAARGTLGDKAAGLAYFFAVMGLYVLASGTLMIYSWRGLGRGERWAWAVTLGNGIFNTVAGVGALAVGFRNPMVWAWFLVATALTVLALTSAKSFARPQAAVA